ncbi:hypothetical protein [Pseudomonas fluorescens]|uniref:hypothetical protein n=1 Tax=Pseudomonas fluorescens TaxID=294 RepID=UPI000A7A9298|nr:hypothetical protein [Pseudomonas fluorescens]
MPEEGGEGNAIKLPERSGFIGCGRFEYSPDPVGAAEGCDFLTLVVQITSQIKRSQPRFT